MYYNLPRSQEQDLLSKPETGMGYQIIEAIPSPTYLTRKYIVLNSQIAVELNGFENSNIKEIVNKGIVFAKSKSQQIIFSSIKVLSEMQFRGLVNEPRNSKENGAIGNPKEFANGSETFVRLSAFEDDLRIDKEKRCLRPGSFTTTEKDYNDCKSSNDDPVERYALPSDERICWAFYILPKSIDTLQRGTVQPANGKRGGGKEAYFENGTSSGTFVKQTPY